MGVRPPQPGVIPDGYRAHIREHLLDVLRDAGQPLDTLELARAAGVLGDKVSIRDMQYHLKRLADAGLVEIEPGSRGRRQHRNTYRIVDAGTAGGVR